jgi:hypothetical protein
MALALPVALVALVVLPGLANAAPIHITKPVDTASPVLPKAQITYIVATRQ